VLMESSDEDDVDDGDDADDGDSEPRGGGGTSDLRGADSPDTIARERGASSDGGGGAGVGVTGVGAGVPADPARCRAASSSCVTSTCTPSIVREESGGASGVAAGGGADEPRAGSASGDVRPRIVRAASSGERPAGTGAAAFAPGGCGIGCVIGASGGRPAARLSTAACTSSVVIPSIVRAGPSPGRMTYPQAPQKRESGSTATPQLGHRIEDTVGILVLLSR
jgi:hypothetical protein